MLKLVDPISGRGPSLGEIQDFPRRRTWPWRRRRLRRTFVRGLAPLVGLIVFGVGVVLYTLPTAEEGDRVNRLISPPMDYMPAADVRVVDGDTIRIGSERIRILNIDAPETRESCAMQRGARAGRARHHDFDRDHHGRAARNRAPWQRPLRPDARLHSSERCGRRRDADPRSGRSAGATGGQDWCGQR